MLHESPPKQLPIKVKKASHHQRMLSEVAPSILSHHVKNQILQSRESDPVVSSTSNRMMVFDNDMHNRVMSMIYEDNNDRKALQRKVVKKS